MERAYEEEQRWGEDVNERRKKARIAGGKGGRKEGEKQEYDNEREENRSGRKVLMKRDTRGMKRITIRRWRMRMERLE